jgi:hypothetical protein
VLQEIGSLVRGLVVNDGHNLAKGQLLADMQASPALMFARLVVLLGDCVRDREMRCVSTFQMSFAMRTSLSDW